MTISLFPSFGCSKMCCTSRLDERCGVTKVSRLEMVADLQAGMDQRLKAGERRSLSPNLCHQPTHDSCLVTHEKRLSTLSKESNLTVKQTLMASTTTTLLPINEGPRVVVYHQTIHRDGKYVSLLPLITNQTGVTHVIVAAIHLNEGPGNITLNDDPPHASKYETLWGEVAWLQASGVKVLGMLGGAAKGSFERLDGPDDQKVSFETESVCISCMCVTSCTRKTLTMQCFGIAVV